MTLETFLAHPAVQALGRALLHFLWQGSVLALLLWIIRIIVPSSAARLRYAAATLILLIMPVILTITASKGLFPGDLRSEAGKTASVNRFMFQPAGASPDLVLSAPVRPSTPKAGIPGWAVCIWIAGVLLLSARALGGWMAVQKLKRSANAAHAELDDMLQRLKLTLRVSAPVRLCTSALVQVPTAIGWLRPYIILPVTALTGLSELQIEAILAHELAHIRRHDYLINLLQTAVETVLFYHPAVWWVGRQMRLEREHCCDDIAVAVCGNAFQYATALAEMEQIRGRTPEPALAATGGELLGRIRRLVRADESDARQERALRPWGTIAAAALVVLLAGTTAMLLHAAPESRFEVASVKPVQNPNQGQLRFPSFTSSGRFTATAPLIMTIVTAYRLPLNVNQRLSGGPEWIRSPEGVYAIDATPEKDSLPAGLSSTERAERMRSMLRSLLAERFKLVMRVEQKEMPYYALVVGKRGPKLQKADITETQCSEAGQGGNDKAAAGAMTSCHSFTGGQGRGLHARAADMGDLVNFVENWTGRPLIDKTGIKGLYRFDTKGWLPLQPAAPPAEGAKSEDGTELRDVPTLFQVFDGLGLRMESRKGKIDTYVIDHIERPAEN